MEPGEGRADRKTQITERGTECEEVREDGERQAGSSLQIEEGMLNSLLRTVEATADKVGAREQVFEEGETCLLKRVPHKTADSKTCTSRDAGILLLTLVR